MRFLADENVHPVVVHRLRELDFVVEWIKETSRGAGDEDILRRPDIGLLVLITYDRDFGDLIYNQGYPAPRTIIYSRLGRAEPRYVADRIARSVEHGLLEHHMITITPQGERVKPFPGVSDG